MIWPTQIMLLIESSASSMMRQQGLTGASRSPATGRARYFKLCRRYEEKSDV